MSTETPELLAETIETITSLQRTVALLKLSGMDPMAIAAGLAMVSAQECKTAYGAAGAAAITSKAMHIIKVEETQSVREE